MDNLRKPVASIRPAIAAGYTQHQRPAISSVSARPQGAVPAAGAPTLGPVLDLKQAAALLHCHPKTLRLMAQANKVPAKRVGKLWRFSARRLREWLEAS